MHNFSFENDGLGGGGGSFRTFDGSGMEDDGNGRGYSRVTILAGIGLGYWVIRKIWSRSKSARRYRAFADEKLEEERSKDVMEERNFGAGITLSGSCMCGKVKIEYAFDDPPQCLGSEMRNVVCYCKDCQRYVDILHEKQSMLIEANMDTNVDGVDLFEWRDMSFTNKAGGTQVGWI